MDVVRQPHKQLRAEAHYYVMIDAPITCLTLSRLQSLLVGREKSIRTKTSVSSKELRALRPSENERDLNPTRVTVVIFYQKMVIFDSI